MGKIVGRIKSVKGLSVRARLFELLPPYLVTNGSRETAPKINGFVKTMVGIETIICQVVGEISEEIDGNIEGHYLDLQVRGHISDKTFIQGLRMLPIVSADIEILDSSDYDTIYCMGSKDTLTIGVDLFDETKKISIDINNIIPSHIGVFGNTGSGKSNTLVKMLKEYESILHEKKTKRGKFIVFDLNNEYSKSAICEIDKKTIYTLKTRNDSSKKIPLSISSLSEDDFIVLMNASEKTQAPVIKSAYRHAIISTEMRTESYYIEHIKSIIKNGRRSLFMTIRFHLSDYIKNIDYFKFNGHPTQNKFFYDDGTETIYLENQSFEEKLNQIKINIPSEKLDRFIFELYFTVANENENGVQLDFMMPLLSRANKILVDLKKVFNFIDDDKWDSYSIFENKNVCIIQLGLVNKDMKEIIPGLISNMIFNRLVKSKDENDEVIQVLNIVIDEAHNILYEDNGRNLSHLNVLDVFEKIVKEGRKFGCFLLLASQRPSDISETIISQLHNYLIHKLVNPSDIARIRKAVAYLDESSLDFITVLAPGECIVSGVAFQMPSYVYVEQVNKEFRPNSENIILIGDRGLFLKN